MTPEDLIQRFHLAPLTGEGGLYRRTYCSARELPAEAFGPQYPAGTRKAAGSAIEYLITPQSYSRLHRLPTDEVYHFYLGDPVALFLIPPQGPPRTVLLGQDVLSGMEVQFVVPAGWWQGSRLLRTRTTRTPMPTRFAGRIRTLPGKFACLPRRPNSRRLPLPIWVHPICEFPVSPAPVGMHLLISPAAMGSAQRHGPNSPCKTAFSFDIFLVCCYHISCV